MFFSCYEDKGNYDYTTINEVTIEFDRSTYSVVALEDNLVITPKITTTEGSEDDLSYVWAVSKIYGTNEKDIAVDTIARTRNLDWPVTLDNGRHILYFRVDNDRTGVSYYHSADVIVATRYSRGFYVLKETSGNSDLDLFIVEPADGTVTPLPDVITTLHGGPIPGRPSGFGIVFQYSHLLPDGTVTCETALNIATDQKEIQIYGIADMNMIYDHETMFFGDDEPDETPYQMWPQVMGVCYASDKGIYFSGQMPPEFSTPSASGKFGYPALGVGEIRPNPNMCMVGTSWDIILLLFDEIEGRLVGYDMNGYSSLFDDAGPEGITPPGVPRGITHRLLFNGSNRLGFTDSGIMIFEDAADHSQRYLYRLEYDTWVYDNPIREIRPLPKSSGINRAQMYAMNEREALVVYYVLDNKIYMYDVGSGEETQLSPQGIGADETITYISNRWYGLEEELAFNHLVIGTSKGDSYKVYLYNTVGPTPNGAPVRTLEGTGKAFGLHYVSEGMNNMDIHGQYSAGAR